jgi:SAM-dependent methyltransferase
MGCGHGFYSIYLAKQGFDVTGVDISGVAIERAKKNALQENVNAHFVELDARVIDQLPGTYEFVFEWGLLHFIFPEFREEYVKNIAEKIPSGGTYMVLTFNEQSPEWGGGKFRTGLSGSPLYYSSMDELIALYKPYFEIVETKIRPTLFKNSGNEHLENYLLLKRL